MGQIREVIPVGRRKNGTGCLAAINPGWLRTLRPVPGCGHSRRARGRIVEPRSEGVPSTTSPAGRQDRRILQHRGAARQFEGRLHKRFLGERYVAAEERRHRFGDRAELSPDLRR